ncbi:MAG: hypothetical protein JOS17DRAFT_843095 [Linnemannia elongata]|nr:MAG: hypothetical protein JOS17DRAFT_843095 [Linnemannia elongata]
MPYKSTLITVILFSVVCLIQGAFADKYEGLCVAALHTFSSESTKECCTRVRADLHKSFPEFYLSCGNMSKGQLDDFTKCCPIDVHVKPKKHHGKGKSKNDKRDTSKRIRRNNKRRNNGE